MADAYRSGLTAAGPDAVAKAIERAVTAARPRPRTVITPVGKILVHLRRLLGSRVWDAFLRQQSTSDSVPRRLRAPDGEVAVAVLADTPASLAGNRRQWMHQAGAGWNRYAADIARSHDHKP